MNVVQICPSPFPLIGGPARNYFQFQTAVASRTVCFVRPGEGVMSECTVKTSAVLKVSAIPILWRFYYVFPWRRRIGVKLIESCDCVIVHAFFRYPAIWAAKYCRRLGIPYFVVLHGAADPWVFKKRALIKRVWMVLFGESYLRNATGVICASNREYQKAARYIRPEQARIIYWACDSVKTETKNVMFMRAAIRRKYLIEPEDKVLIYFGRLDSMKRPVETVQMCAKSGIRSLRLLVMGPDGDVTAAKLKRIAKKMNWDGLRIVGPVFDRGKYTILSAADGYISLSYRENYNFSAAEAMSCGLPVILSPGNDLGWEFFEKDCGWQLQTDEPKEIIARLHDFVGTSHDKLREMGARGRSWVEENLSFAKFSDSMQKMVEQAVSPRLKKS
jgi:glycosyltransferase involved in cell wall biosynthesis